VGWSGPATYSRTTEWIPSAPTTQLAAYVGPVGEADRNLRTVLLNRNATRPERDVLIAHGGPQRIMEVGSVHVVERRAPAGLPGVGKRDPAEDRAALPVTNVPRLRADAHRPERLCEPQPVQALTALAPSAGPHRPPAGRVPAHTPGPRSPTGQARGQPSTRPFRPRRRRRAWWPPALPGPSHTSTPRALPGEQ
jgi:hypothetical protein